ncbi:MAG: DUF5050 domain-containing protein, partial [Acidobacteriota bacterium]|nr:DUF5050 domain-containing protein [Acidobacteriota bacterium]
MEDAGQQSLWVRHIATGSNVPIIPPAEVVYDRMTFSPDGSYLYFIKTEKSDPIRTLYQMPVLGGEQRKLISNVDSPITLSPDARRFAFVRDEAGESTIFIANADGTGEQKLATIKRPGRFKNDGPAWSPDGKVIASGAVSFEGGFHHIILEVRLADGSIKPLAGPQKWSGVDRVAWLADGSGLIATCEEQGSNTHQVYQFSYPGGKVRRITNDVNNYHDTSLTTNSSAMVTVQENRVSNIWIAPDGDVSRARQLTYGSEEFDGATGLQWTPDAKIVYVSRTGGLRRIWIMNGDGSNQRQVTDRRSVTPAVSPDGRYIVFVTNGPILRMDIDGGNLKQLTSGKGDSSPCISPDGRWVVYTSSSSEGASLWKVSIDGGESVRLTDNYSRSPVVSPDGKQIACHYREKQNSEWRIAIIPFEGGRPTKLLDIAGEIRIGNRDNPAFQVVRWLPDGRSLAYIVTREGVSNIWSLPVDGGPPKQLTNFTSGQIFWFDLSRDGKPNLFARGATTKDVVLISGFRQ